MQQKGATSFSSKNAQIPFASNANFSWASEVEPAHRHEYRPPRSLYCWQNFLVPRDVTPKDIEAIVLVGALCPAVVVDNFFHLPYSSS